ncbi:MAG: hypothetical protein HY401_02600 [Elusimicrobia bacterium]|nr:hypothetical protein [Elusimicrobiota bacterium]
MKKMRNLVLITLLAGAGQAAANPTSADDASLKLKAALEGQTESAVAASIDPIKTIEKTQWNEGGDFQVGGFLGQTIEDINGSGSGSGLGFKARIPLRYGIGLEPTVGSLRAGYKQTWVGPGDVYPGSYNYIFTDRFWDEGGDRYFGGLLFSWRFHPALSFLKRASVRAGALVGSHTQGDHIYDRGWDSYYDSWGRLSRYPFEFHLYDDQVKNWGVFPAVGASYDLPLFTLDDNGTKVWKLAVEAGWLRVFNAPRSRNYLLLNLVAQKHQK